MYMRQLCLMLLFCRWSPLLSLTWGILCWLPMTCRLLGVKRGIISLAHFIHMCKVERFLMPKRDENITALWGDQNRLVPYFSSGLPDICLTYSQSRELLCGCGGHSLIPIKSCFSSLRQKVCCLLCSKLTLMNSQECIDRVLLIPSPFCQSELKSLVFVLTLLLVGQGNESSVVCQCLCPLHYSKTLSKTNGAL